MTDATDRRADSLVDAFDQTMDARDMLLLPPSSYLRFPFDSLHNLTGLIAPGNVWFLAAFSGNGKTALLMSLVLAMLQRGDTVYYLGLESRPNILRTHLACCRLQLDVGDVISGAAKLMPGWPETRGELLADLEKQRALVNGWRFLVNGQPWIDLAGMKEAAHEAALHRADLVIVDHIDHVLLDETSNAYQQSRLVTQELKMLADEYNLRFLVSTQLNNDAVRGDRLAVYAPPQPQHVYMGAHKRMIATGMLGLYRPVREDASPDELKAVREHRAEPSSVLTPGTMGVVCMKHRHYGSREGQRALMSVTRGIVSELAERDRYGTSYQQQRAL